MRNKFTVIRSLTIASTKMYFRNTTALFFTLFVPILIIVVIGLISSGSGNTKFDISLTNLSAEPLSKQFITRLKEVKSFEIHEMSTSEGRTKLEKGKTDLVVTIPSSFGRQNATGQLQPVEISTYYNQSRPQNGQTAQLIFGQIISGFNANVSKAPQPITLKSEGVKTSNLGAIDFTLPGMIAFSIMQLGIFSVAFAFVSYKSSGALRRLQATPTRPLYFLVAQGLTRLIVGVGQAVLLIAVSVVFFKAKVSLASIPMLLTVVVLGIVVFINFGFTVAGWAKDENQAAPIANLMQLPMTFLSGVFFPKELFPHYLQSVAKYLPLTYLSDALRKITTEQAGFVAIRGELLGLLVWGVIMFIVANRVFNWE